MAQRLDRHGSKALCLMWFQGCAADGGEKSAASGPQRIAFCCCVDETLGALALAVALDGLAGAPQFRRPHAIVKHDELAFFVGSGHALTTFQRHRVGSSPSAVFFLHCGVPFFIGLFLRGDFFFGLRRFLLGRSATDGWLMMDLAGMSSGGGRSLIVMRPDASIHFQV
jgi:hypothetical protein